VILFLQHVSEELHYLLYFMFYGSLQCLFVCLCVSVCVCFMSMGFVPEINSCYAMLCYMKFGGTHRKCIEYLTALVPLIAEN